MIDWNVVEEQFGNLSLREQMLLLERLMRKMRESAYLELSTEEADQGLDELANENFNAPYPIPEGTYSEDQLRPRGDQ